MHKALITGVTGMDGSHLAEFLLEKGYEVHGIVRRTSTFNRERIDHIYKPDNESNFFLHYGDITDPFSLIRILNKVKPDEVYHLAAQSHVQVSFETPYYTAQATGIGTLNLLEAIRSLELNPRIYIASTSELYSGKEEEQDELTPLKPKSPYGVAKLYSHEIGRVYRESYGMFIARGILFNHEGERRGENFVTQKIANGVKEIVLGKRKKLKLGNLDAKRDWGYAPDYVEAMWLMLQAEEPDDYVVATNETHSVRNFCEEAFNIYGLHWEDYVEVSDQYIRLNEVDTLKGNYKKIKEKLGWTPKTKFKELVKKMVSLKESK